MANQKNKIKFFQLYQSFRTWKYAQ